MSKIFNYDFLVGSLLDKNKKTFIDEINNLSFQQNQREHQFSEVFNILAKTLSSEQVDGKHKDDSNFANTINLFAKTFESFTVSPDNICNIHKSIYGDNDAKGGKLKQTSNCITTSPNSKKRIVWLMGTSVEDTPIELKSLCDAFNKAWNNPQINKLVLIPYFIFDFIRIHPFSDGNGRVSRILTFVLLLKAGFSVFKYVKFENINTSRLRNYYVAEHKALISKGGVNYWFIILNQLINIKKAYKKLDELFAKTISKQKLVKDPLISTMQYSLLPFSKQELYSLFPDIKHETIDKTIDDLIANHSIQKLNNGQYQSLFRKKN